MNRRDLLKSLCMAPVALPMAAHAAVADSGIAKLGMSFTLKPVSFGRVYGWDAATIEWTDWATLHGPEKPDVARDFERLTKAFDPVVDATQHLEHATKTMADALVKLVDKAASIPTEIETQMRDDDLFDHEPLVTEDARHDHAARCDSDNELDLGHMSLSQ